MKRHTTLLYLALIVLVLILFVQVDARKHKDKTSRRKGQHHHRHGNKQNGNEDITETKKHRKGRRKHTEETGEVTANPSPESGAAFSVDSPTEEHSQNISEPLTEKHSKKHKHKNNKERKKDHDTENKHNHKNRGHRNKHNGRKRQQENQERQNQRKTKRVEFCDEKIEEEKSCSPDKKCCVVNGNSTSCENVPLHHGKCHHQCQCAPGLHCIKENDKQRSKRPGKCQPLEKIDGTPQTTTPAGTQQNEQQNEEI